VTRHMDGRPCTEDRTQGQGHVPTAQSPTRHPPMPPPKPRHTCTHTPNTHTSTPMPVWPDFANHNNTVNVNVNELRLGFSNTTCASPCTQTASPPPHPPSQPGQHPRDVRCAEISRKVGESVVEEGSGRTGHSDTPESKPEEHKPDGVAGNFDTVHVGEWAVGQCGGWRCMGPCMRGKRGRYEWLCG
jgi:hypothetical protein